MFQQAAMSTSRERATSAFSGPAAWTVAGLLLAVSDALAARFSAVSVRGELSGFTRAASGHCYFTLKDASGAGAALRCAMFRRAAVGMSFVPRDGQQVAAQVEVIVPNSGTIIQSNDHVILFLPNKRLVHEVEALFRVGVTFF